MTWRLALPDWKERIKRRESLLPPGLPLVEAEALRAVSIFDRLRIPDVPGTPPFGEACGDWFRDALRALFGSYDPTTGMRHIRELFILVPKKNAKTTNGAGLMLTAMFMSRRPRAEFLLVAPTHEVSELAFSQAVGMIELDPVLMAKCHIQSHIKRITYRQTGCFLKIKSFDPKVVTGSKPAGVLLDETHVTAEATDADRVIGQLRGGLVSQPEGFLVQITTQSEREPAGVFKAELQKARAVRDGQATQLPLLPLLYEFPDDVDWQDPANWPMVLPNLGRSITVERLLEDRNGAEAAGLQEFRRWASQHLNVQIGVALRDNYWPGALYWAKAVDPTLADLAELLRRSEVVVCGIDGGGKNDLLGLAFIGREVGTGRWLVWTRAWCFPSAMEQNKPVAHVLDDFIRDGDLVLVDDDTEDDVWQVAELVRQVKDSGLLSRIGVDPVAIAAITDAITSPTEEGGAGIAIEDIVSIGQGWKLTGAIKTAERKLSAGTMTHPGTALMTWCVGNAKCETRGNATLITKQESGRAKIDPLIAVFNAVSLMSTNPEATRSWWDTPDTADAEAHP